MNDLWSQADSLMDEAEGYEVDEAARVTDSVGRPLRSAPVHPLDRAADLLDAIDELEAHGKFEEAAPNRSSRWAKWHVLAAKRQQTAGFPGRATDHLELAAGLYANEGNSELGAQLYRRAAELYRNFDDLDRARTALQWASELES